MGLFGKLRGKEKERRVVFIGLDGTPYTFMQRLIAEGRAPNAARLAEQGSLLRMESVWPWVSSVAWSTMMTGVNPASTASLALSTATRQPTSSSSPPRAT